ncbi:MAG: GxxExxY protein [Planctomycetes bacterium]|nr:GxxExxY protein [Planctomycetota bacterium]
MSREPFDVDKVAGPGERRLDHDAQTESVIGAAIEVHRILGPGFLESVYEMALVHELTIRRIAFARQVDVDIDYKGQTVGAGRLDFLVGGNLVVELKAVDTILPIHTAQVLSYLKATRKKTALLINFNVTTLKDGLRRISL